MDWDKILKGIMLVAPALFWAYMHRRGKPEHFSETPEERRRVQMLLDKAGMWPLTPEEMQFLKKHKKYVRSLLFQRPLHPFHKQWEEWK